MHREEGCPRDIDGRDALRTADSLVLWSLLAVGASNFAPTVLFSRFPFKLSPRYVHLFPFFAGYTAASVYGFASLGSFICFRCVVSFSTSCVPFVLYQCSPLGS